MKGLAIWARRGSGRFLAVAQGAFVLTLLFSQPDWQREYDWATRLTAGSVILVTAMVAAVAAFDTARLRPTVALLAPGSTRGRWQIVLPALAVVGWSMVAYAVAWLVAAGWVMAHDGVGPTDWWVFPEVLAPLLAAGMVGSLVGSWLNQRWVAPAGAMATVTTSLVAAPWGRGPFEAVTTFGTLTGLERSGSLAIKAILAALIVGAATFVTAVWLSRSGRWRAVTLGGCLVVVLVTSLVPAATMGQRESHSATSEPYGCIGTEPSVCAPRSRLPLMTPVQASLAEAYLTLAGTEFTRPKMYRITRLDHYSDLAGAAPLEYGPEYVRDGRYDPGAVARTLIRPHQCVELFEAETAAPILEAQGPVLAWLESAIRGQVPARPVPAEISELFRPTLECEPTTWDVP